MRTTVRAGLATAVLGIAIAAGSFIFVHGRYTQPGPLAAPATVIIEKGSGLNLIARQLYGAGVIGHPLIFMLGVRYDGLTTDLRAGEYTFPPHVSMRKAASRIASGETVVRRLTVPEGLTADQALAIVRDAEGLVGTMPSDIGEGTILPETYHYSWGDARSELIARMRQSMQTTLDELWPARAEGLALRQPSEAIVLASIIEKETGRSDERARISAVFHNRLRRGMPLQSDPTVVFALAGGAGPLDRPLTRGDLATNSPYNTYLNRGLPPGPIANPGRAALEAALHPAATKDLYFVADGTGGHRFATTLAEHNRNVARFRRIQQQQKSGR
jgi:UPF0755 protein